MKPLQDDGAAAPTGPSEQLRDVPAADESTATSEHYVKKAKCEASKWRPEHGFGEAGVDEVVRLPYKDPWICFQIVSDATEIQTE